MPAFTQHSGASADPLVGAFLAGTSGISVVPGSVFLNASAASAVGYYDGSLAGLGIGAGLIMTSGLMPGTSNTSTSYGVSNGAGGSPLIDAVINPVFSTVSYDASTLAFQFEVTDPTATSISFDLVFGSDEFPEWVDQFVDSAVVYVNGVNHAYFDHDPAHPLSVISQNIAAGYFNNNASGALPIEYDGVSNKLTFVAPIVPGQVNDIAIAISDTGDHILDSGVILSSLTAGDLPGSGVVVKQPGSETEGDDLCVGSSLSEVFDLKGGNDTAYGAGGDDIMSGGSGMDDLDGGSGDDALSGGADDDILDGGSGDDTASYSGASGDYDISYDAASGAYTITALAAGSLEGTDTLTNIEKLHFADGLFALAPGGITPVPTGGGTTVNTPGAISLAGVAAEGQTLTATVSDVDGIAGPVSYTWQVSTDGGASWSPLAGTTDSFLVTGDQAGADIRVLGSYTDGLGAAEALTSATKTVSAGATGDLQITLLNIDAPAGATVASPLTTLVLRAIELGLTPNTAEEMVTSVLLLPGDENLLHYDAYAAVLANPGDTQALTYFARMEQVTILTSLSDDDTAEGLVVRMIEAWQAGQTLDLSNADDLGTILGIPPVPDASGNFPEPLKEIEDRCASIQGILDDGAGLDALDQEWADFASVQETVFVGSLAGLISHINQAPVGFAEGALAGEAGTPVTITEADLLAGFSDPEGAALAVTGLAADKPGTLVQNPDGSWTFTPDAAGAVEFSYTVSDPEGLAIAGAKVMVVAAAPVTNTPPVAVDDTADTAIGTPVSIAPLANDTDADAGDTLTLDAITAAPQAGSAVPEADGSVTYTPLARWFGTDSFAYQVSDASGATDTGVVTVNVAGPAGLSTGPVIHDDAGTKAWSSRFDTFDTAGDMVGRTVIYDDGRIAETSYTGGLRTGQTVEDAGDAASWATIERTFDPVTGERTSSVLTRDDGIVVETTYANGVRVGQVSTDPADAKAWTQITRGYDAAGVLTGVTVENDNGVVTETSYANGVRAAQTLTDTADQFAWAERSKLFDAAGELDFATTDYDDGRVFELDYTAGVRTSGLMTDVGDAYAWATKEYSYDAAGNLLDVMTTPDLA